MDKSNPNSSISISGGSFYGSSIAAGSEAQAHTTVNFNQRSFNAAQTPTEFIAELEKLRDQFAQASKDNIIDEETATDVEYQITKAVQQAKKSNPDKKAIIRRLSTVKVLLEKITVASEWITVVAGAIDAVKKLF